MARTGKSTPGMFGSYNNYDEKGKRTGKTVPGAFGSYVTYDNKGRKTGTSVPDAFGGYRHYDSKGRKVGSSAPGAFGNYHHYDKNGKKTGESNRNAIGSYDHDDNKDACYIATCVYGSYDCPEVLVLRWYRDNVLKRSKHGRLFIRLYYAISPHVVRRFGRYSWFHRFWRNTLDRMISRIK